ncbi:hypothetical protein [Bartonella sp. B17]
MQRIKSGGTTKDAQVYSGGKQIVVGENNYTYNITQKFMVKMGR